MIPPLYIDEIVFIIYNIYASTLNIITCHLAYDGMTGNIFKAGGGSMADTITYNGVIFRVRSKSPPLNDTERSIKLTELSSDLKRALDRLNKAHS